MKKFPLILIVLCCTAQAFCQQFWDKQDVQNFQKSAEEMYQRKSVPAKYDIYNLELTALTTFLKTSTTEIILELPNGKGSLEKFRVKTSSNLAPELAIKFPMIQSYTGYGIDDPSAIAKIDIGTKGFHAVIFSGEHSTTYIDPHTKDKASYLAYTRKNLDHSDRDFMCHHDTFDGAKKPVYFGMYKRNADDGMLRTYRLALACTGEYAQFHLNDQNVDDSASEAMKKAAVLSAMNTSMNRLNGIFERDLGVRMELVADNDKIIFLNPNTDGFTDNDIFELVYENQAICDAEIGSENYDIGHVFGTSGGGAGAGVAGVGVVCNESSKGLGVTGLGNPINDPFDIDFAAHEFGHQFGALHTQNNDDCVRSDESAVEPGSGSTIMGYAGICIPNVQLFSDDYFNTISIEQMWNYIETAGACAVQTDTGNTAPTADAGPDVTIPPSTPFVLRGIATDADGLSSLTYNWEQIDNEVGAVMPPASTNIEGPMFRSLPSKTLAERYLPELIIIATNSTGLNAWEVLPSVAREMNFAFTVRDNHPGGGNTARDDKVVTVVDAEPFVVTVPSAALQWEAESTQTVLWNVGTTNVAPIDSQLVNIKLSTDSGRSFPVTILANTPNDGMQEVVIPNTPTNRARIMVEAADNIFYNMSTSDFIITESTASVDENTLRNFALYPNPTQGLVTVSFDSENASAVDIQLYDVRGRTVKQFSYRNATTVFSKNLDVASISSGIYLIKIQNGTKSTVKKLIIE